jgi:thiol-disulfide isomerase/thioredoxin
MFKSIVCGILLLLSVGLVAQNEGQVELRCELVSCIEERLSLYRFDGNTFIVLQETQKEEDGTFTFQVPASAPRFYYVGTTPSNVLPLILGDEKEVVLKGNCTKIARSNFVKSDLNKDYLALKTRMSTLQQKSTSLERQHPRVFGREREVVVQKLQDLDQKKKQLLDSLKQENPFLGKIVALNTYLSYVNNAGEYTSEVEYFAKEFFAHADFKDPAYNHLPWVFEAFRNYTSTITSVRLSESQQKAYIEEALAQIPKGSDAHQLALLGVINTTDQKKSTLFNHFGDQFITVFSEKSPDAAASVKAKLDKAKAFMVGGVAPDFTQKTPEGEDMSLSDLRGKVVLIDFWASWCGPCRRENPNVVRMYEQYKDKGFEIIGVSLDNNKDKWLAAIEKDGLGWHHVSDLKGWKNEVANLYGVRSIPHTILLDKEGRIMARNLRGVMLEDKLKAVFE